MSSTLPAGVSFNADAAQLELGALPYVSVGRHTFTLMASDGNADTAVPLNVEITIRERDLAPVWNLPTALQTSQEAEGLWDLKAEHWVLDANGDPLSFSLSSASGAALPVGIHLDGAILVVDPGTAVGSYSLKLGASDGPDRPAVQAITTLVVQAAPLVQAPALQVQGVSEAGEGSSFGLDLMLDGPAPAEISLSWSLVPRFDQAEALLPNRSGLLRIAAGADRARLTLPSRNDGLLLGDQELELRLQTLSGDVRLPEQPTRLMLREDDAIPLLLSSRWLSASELELVYEPGAAASAGSGLVLCLSDPSGTGLLEHASLSDVFLSGWVGETRADGNLELRWSDPLAATWPGTAAVSLARLRLDNAAAASPK
ncbi:MAG: hypothetical protein ACO262_12115, partial [Vulcanococcus sp.]